MPTAFSAADRRRLALAERARLRATLAGLTPEQWATPSLCAGWTVREVAGHVVDSARTRTLLFLAGMAATRFDHDAYNRKAATRWAARPTEELVAALDTDRIMGVFAMQPSLLMVDTVVHHQDIRRPLGLGTYFPHDLLAATLSALVSEGAFAADARRVADRRLVATDIDWSHGSEGAALRAPAEHLVMTITGRVVGFPVSPPRS